MRRQLILALIISLSLLTGNVRADMTEYILGDIDGGIYDSVGSVDDVYVDPDRQTLTAGIGAGTHTRGGFDFGGRDYIIPFTFLIDLTEGDKIVSAELSLTMRATNSNVQSDRIYFESAGHYYRFLHLGWLPIPVGNEFVTRSLELGDILGNNELAFLDDGKLNVLVADDVLIDYATLTIDAVPAPAAVLLGSIGLSFSGWLLRRKASH